MDFEPTCDNAKFLICDVLGIGQLRASTRYAHIDDELIASVLEQGRQFISAHISSLNSVADRVGASIDRGNVRCPPGFREAYAKFAEAGWPSLNLPDELGGQDLPLVLQAAFSEMVCGACLAFSMLPVMARAGTHVLMKHGTPDLLGKYGPHLATGRDTATICITEPDAGSDVGRIRTAASAQPDGTWRIDGTKIFISFGDHDLTEQIVHFVLARTSPAPTGTRGLGLFLVPKLVDGGAGAQFRNSVKVVRLEHKMGMNGSPTCQLDFEGAQGFLIGEENRGLNALFTMINLMRLEVAIQGVGIAERATQAAVSYAIGRRQGGPASGRPEVIANHPDVRRMLLTMRAETIAMRALVLEAALQLDLASAAGDEQTRRRAQYLAEFLLPICKARAAETGQAVANLAVQVFGGHGYITDNGVEQNVRDSRVLSIYEGTNGIQAIDLALRKIPADDGARWRIFRDSVTAEIGNHQASIERSAVEDCLTRLERLVAGLPDRSKRAVEAGASPLLELIGLTACGWMWLRILRAATSPDQGKQITWCARWWAEQIAPLAGALEARALAGAGTIEAVEPEMLVRCGRVAGLR